MQGAELVARQLVRQGVELVFGLPGHLESVFGALDQQGVRVLHLRHEASVVMAADAAARIGRCVGVAIVTAGPGLANALGGLATTSAAGSPVVVLCGRNPVATSEANAFQDLDHVRLARPLVKWATTVPEAALLPEYVERAVTVALAGRPGPVLLEIPQDLVLADVPVVDRAGGRDRPARPATDDERPAPAAAAVARAARLVAGAVRPLVIAGNGAYWSGAGDALQRLAARHGLPVLGRALGRGLVPEDGRSGYSWPHALVAARHADVVVLAGSRCGGPVGFAAPPFFDERVALVQIDIDPTEIGRGRPVAAPVVGDCAAALGSLSEALDGLGHDPVDPTWVAKALERKQAALDAIGTEGAGPVHPLDIGRALARAVPADAILVGDGANCLSWVKAATFVTEAPGYLDHDPLGSMGVGLPLALGAAAVQQGRPRPRPVVLATGDGAFGQYLGELPSAVLHRLPVLVVVANDGCWGSSLGVERRLGLARPVGVELEQSRYDRAAEAFGWHGEHVAGLDELAPALERALAATAAGRPALVNVLVDREASLERSSPLVQQVPFNPAYATWRQQIALDGGD